jgi:hypothetical protein
MRAALASSAEGQSRGLSPAPTGIASLPAAAKPPQWELQPESYAEFTNAYTPPYYLDVNSGETKAVGQPVQATGVTPVDPNTLAQHVGPNFQGTPTQFYDEQGNLKGVLVDAVRAGLNTREGELILDPMSLGLALKPGETASLNSALQQRNEQGQLLFIDPFTGDTTIFNTGVPAATGSTVKDLLYINERKYGGQIPADTVQGALLLASMMATGGVGSALMNAAGIGSLSTGSALADAAIRSALMQGGKTALTGGNLEAILKSAGIGAATSAAGDLASDYLGDLAGEYLGGDYVGLSDAGANELMGDYSGNLDDLMQQYYPDGYVDSGGTINADWRDGSSVHEGYGGNIDDSPEYIEPAANKAKDSLGIQAAPQETIDAMVENYPDFQLVQGSETPPLSLADNPLYGTQAMPLQQEQLADLTIPTADNYDIPMLDVSNGTPETYFPDAMSSATAGVPEQALADQIATNPEVPVSDVLSNNTIVTLLAGGASVAAIAAIINAIGGSGGGESGSGSGGGEGGGDNGGGSGGGGGGSSGGGGGGGGSSAGEGGSEESTEDDEETKKKKQQQVALAAIEAIAARTPPGAQIDYLYDIGGESIFAPMRQQRARQDWAYEPNDRFAQGGMVAFDEGGLASLDVPEKKGVLARMVEPETKVVEALAAYGSNPEKYENIYSFYTNPNRPVVDKDRKELPSGLSEMSKDYSGLDMAVLGMLHSAKQSGNPERFLESLAPYFDQKVKFDFSDRRGPSGYVLPIVAPNTANIAQKGVQANSPSFANPTSNIFFHELEHTLQNKDRGYPSAVANALTNDALLSRMDKDMLKRAKEYRFTNPTMDKARAFPAENAFDNPSETLANIAAAAQGMAMQGKDYLQTEEGQALFPTDTDKNYFYNATLPGVTSMRQDMGFFEPKSESRLKKDESIAQTVARKLGFAQGGITNLLRSK